MLGSGWIANRQGCQDSNDCSGKSDRSFGQNHQRPHGHAFFPIILRVIEGRLRRCLPQVRTAQIRLKQINLIERMNIFISHRRALLQFADVLGICHSLVFIKHLLSNFWDVKHVLQIGGTSL